MPSKKPYFALTLATAALGIAVVFRPTAHAASATLPLQDGIAVCYHVDPSDYRCPDSLMTMRYPVPQNALEVQSVAVTVTYKDGRKVTSQLPATTDAVFLSKKSLRAFLLLHYLATDDKKFSDLLNYINKAQTTAPPVRKPPEK
jgi:hypothetical protein